MEGEPDPLGLCKRPHRLVLWWAAGAVVLVAASTLYLSMMVHMATLVQRVRAVETELAAQRQRGEMLEVALAKTLSPENTDRIARVQLAMAPPDHVNLLPVGAAGLAGRGDATGSSETVVARAGGQQGSSPHRETLVGRVAAAVAGLFGGGSQAQARQSPSWP